MSPKLQSESLNMHLPSRIGSAMLLLAMVVYVIAMVLPMFRSSQGLSLSLWPDTLAGLLVLAVFGVPAGQYALKGHLD